MIGSTIAAKLARFAGVGAAVTLVYAVVTWGSVAGLGLSAIRASLAGFCLAMALSYAGQKYLTFRSAGAHRLELPRFLVTSCAAFAGSVGTMAVVAELGWDYRLGILGAALFVPAASFVTMNLWVFRQRPRRDAVPSLGSVESR